MKETHCNPLLADEELVDYARLRPEHIGPAIEQLLAEARAAVDAVGADARPAGWETVAEPVEAALQRLGRAWSAVSHLHSVADSEALRAQYNASQPRVTTFWAELSQDLALYERYKQLAAAPEATTWPGARRRCVDNELRDFRLGGAELDRAGRERLKAVHERESALATRFAENVLDATQGGALWIDDEQVLDGIPADVIAQYREAAQAEARPGFRLGLQAPAYLPAMQYARSRPLRERLYRAYSQRASEFGPPEWDNTALILETLALRGEQARLLGYRDYAELSLVTKMARSAEEVLAFLRDLSRRSRRRAGRDLQELEEFAAASLGLPQLQAWDLAYASEQLRRQRYDYSEQELKPYFPVERVLAGLFELLESLLGLRIVPDQAPTWHAEVRMFRVETQDGELQGRFYLDLYARAHKQGGAWQDDARSRWRHAGHLQTPVSFLTCNFSPPVGGRPALFTHDEVLTLLHEFGHGMHHLLTRVDEPPVAGIRGVEWDAVELPSQWLENFGWEWDILQRFSGHVDRGEPLPRALFDRMRAARNFQSGMRMARQVEFGIVDMLLHTGAVPADGAALQALVEQVREEVAVVRPPADQRGLHSFTHVFAGGYAAGYYSYLWAEVLSADCYAAFEEGGAPAYPALGRRLLDAVLAVGGSRPAMESFVAFRGREPDLSALLRHNGLEA